MRKEEDKGLRERQRKRGKKGGEWPTDRKRGKEGKRTEYSRCRVKRKQAGTSRTGKKLSITKILWMSARNHREAEGKG